MVTEPMSLRAFGRKLGVSDAAVRKAIKSGRLRRGVGQHDGRIAILDAQLAAEDWVTSRVQAPRERRSAPAHPSPSTPAASDAQRTVEGTLADAQRRVVLERERKLRLENDAREGRLVAMDDAIRAQQSIAAAVKAQLLSVPRRAVLTGLPREYEPLLKNLITDALRELAAIGSLPPLEQVAEQGAA